MHGEVDLGKFAKRPLVIGIASELFRNRACEVC